jgi:hypothetical protein
LVVVKAALAVAAVVTLGGESAGDGLGDPFVFFLAVAPCFVVNTLAHLEEEALSCVRATVIELGCLHTDNAPEFGETNAPMQEVLKRHGLYGALTTCAPYTPRQNGVAERMWRTLTEPSIAKLVRARLPASFWW